MRAIERVGVGDEEWVRLLKRKKAAAMQKRREKYQEQWALYFESNPDMAVQPRPVYLDRRMQQRMEREKQRTEREESKEIKEIVEREEREKERQREEMEGERQREESTERKQRREESVSEMSVRCIDRGETISRGSNNMEESNSPMDCKQESEAILDAAKDDFEMEKDEIVSAESHTREQLNERELASSAGSSQPDSALVDTTKQMQKEEKRKRRKRRSRQEMIIWREQQQLKKEARALKKNMKGLPEAASGVLEEAVPHSQPELVWNQLAGQGDNLDLRSGMSAARIPEATGIAEPGIHLIQNKPDEAKLVTMQAPPSSGLFPPLLSTFVQPSDSSQNPPSSQYLLPSQLSHSSQHPPTSQYLFPSQYPPSFQHLLPSQNPPSSQHLLPSQNPPSFDQPSSSQLSPLSQHNVRPQYSTFNPHNVNSMSPSSYQPVVTSRHSPTIQQHANSKPSISHQPTASSTLTTTTQAKATFPSSQHEVVSQQSSSTQPIVNSQQSISSQLNVTSAHSPSNQPNAPSQHSPSFLRPFSSFPRPFPRQDTETLVLPSDPMEWTSAEAAAWLVETFNVKETVDLLKGEDLDGMAILGLTHEACSDIGLCLGPAIYLLKIVEAMKVARRKQFC